MKFMVLVTLIVMAKTPLFAAVLVEDGETSTLQAGEVQNIENNSYKSAIELDEFNLRKTEREQRFGVGMKFSGEVGAAGVHAEVRIIDDLAMGVSYGFGTGFQSLGVRMIQYFSEDKWSFYGVGGFSKWFSGNSSDEGLTESNPDFLAKRFLNSQERESGVFSESILYPGLGVRYLIENGELRGMAFQAELLVLADIDDLNTAISGSVGATYYF